MAHISKFIFNRVPEDECGGGEGRGKYNFPWSGTVFPGSGGLPGFGAVSQGVSMIARNKLYFNWLRI